MFIPLRDITSRVVRGKGLEPRLKQTQMLAQAQNIFQELWGSAAAQSIKISRFENGVLSCEALSSSLAQELKMRESFIINKLHARFPDICLNKIQIVVR